MKKVKITECPRDAMQGFHTYIPAEVKAAYINQLLKCGFDTIDAGSFVSPKAIPQMRDTAEVLRMLDLRADSPRLLAIVANVRGATEALAFDEIACLGYPFSVSETFQLRNTNAGMEESLARVEEISTLCLQARKKLVVYISMAFGNPYGDPWHPDLVTTWCNKLSSETGVKVLLLSDTVGSGTPETISSLFSTIIPALPGVETGAHLHAVPADVKAKVAAAYSAGCRQFDAAIKGLGGCPMAADKLTGNMDTELMLDYFAENEIPTAIDHTEFGKAVQLAAQTFPQE